MRLSSAIAALSFAIGASGANAVTVDITSAGATGTAANGTIYTQSEIKSGTGIFGPFLRVHDGGNDSPDQQGYNGNFAGGADPWDSVGGVWTRPVKFGDLVYKVISGTGYYEFLLDINEPNADSKKYVSLDSVRIWASSSPKTADYEVSGLPAFGAPLYDMDNAGDTTVKLNGGDGLGVGSGRSDMAMYILASYFNGVGASQYMTFYSRFGGGLDPDDVLADGGFEEWSFRDCSEGGCDTRPSPPEVPLPGTLGLLGVGVLGLGVARRRIKV